MTEYRFSEVAVWTDLGGTPRLARRQRVDVKDWATGLPAPDLTQDGQPVSYLTSNSQGTVTFTSTVGVIIMSTLNGPPITVYSPDRLAEGGSGGGGGGLTVVNNGDGTLTLTASSSGGSSVVNNGDGTLTLT